MTAVLLLLLALQPQDPVRVQTRLVDEEIQAGESTVLRVEVETTGERAEIGRFRSLPPGLELAGTRDSDQRQFSIPGGTRRFVTREFTLRARAPGRYRIPALDVVVGGQSYTTRSLLLDVTASPDRRTTGAGADAVEGAILQASLDSDTVYVGEQVTLRAEAMFSQDVRFRLRRAPEYEPPTPSGFWVYELPVRQRSSTRSLDGDMYEVQRFERAFFPMAPGRYEIPPARLEFEVRRGLLYSPESRELATDPLPLVVLPLPDDAPPAFTGAVGSYTIRGQLQPTSVPAGEAAVLSVVVEGEGNVKTLPPPVTPEIEGVDVYPPSEEADTEVFTDRVGGSKTFSWVLIPREAGTIEVPAVRYPYFDPGTASFETATLPPMELEVTAGSVRADRPPPATIRYLKSRPESGDPLGWVQSREFAAAQALPLLLLAFGLAWRRRRSRGQAPASRRALRRRRARGVRELEERAARGGPDFFADAEAFAREWLADRLGLDSTRGVGAASLREAGVGEETARSVVALIDRLAAGRYSPSPPAAGSRRDIVRALGRALERVDREASAPRRARTGRGPGQGRGGAASALALVLCAAAVAPAAVPAAARAQTAPDRSAAPTFQEAVEAFDQERYDEAAAAFDRYLRLHPDDAAGWYNLGTSYHRAGHPGYAIWGWLEALRLDPRDADTRHNLRVAGVPPELVDRVAPPLYLRPAEILFAAALAWFVAGIAGALWLVRRRRAAGSVALVALILALALGLTGWDSTRDPRVLIVLEPSTLRAGPALRGDPIAELEPGTGLTPVETRGDWVRARTARGDEGWVEANATGRI